MNRSLYTVTVNYSDKLPNGCYAVAHVHIHGRISYDVYISKSSTVEEVLVSFREEYSIRNKLDLCPNGFTRIHAKGSYLDKNTVISSVLNDNEKCSVEIAVNCFCCSIL